LPPPIDYFLKYFTENDIEEMAGYTNIYAQQTGVKNFIETNSSEIKTFIGISFTNWGLWPPSRSYVLATEIEN